MPTKSTEKKILKKPATRAASKKRPKKEEYIQAVGRRKTSTATVRISDGNKSKLEFTVNQKNYKDYFPYIDQQKTVLKPLEIASMLGGMKISALVKGGGSSGQAGAVCHGLARALVKYNPDLKPVLKAEGLLTRDPRMVERKKYGLRKARRAPQWSKR